MLNNFVGAKNEAVGLGLIWAHNLFVMWVLDFLVWIVPNTETQQGNFSLRAPLLPLLLFSCCSLAPILRFLWNLSTTSSSPLSSHIYSPMISGES